jgi:hypothetical protein
MNDGFAGSDAHFVVKPTRVFCAPPALLTSSHTGVLFGRQTPWRHRKIHASFHHRNRNAHRGFHSRTGKPFEDEGRLRGEDWASTIVSDIFSVSSHNA